jgi:hypothetical protein
MGSQWDRTKIYHQKILLLTVVRIWKYAVVGSTGLYGGAAPVTTANQRSDDSCLFQDNSILINLFSLIN